LLKIVLAFKTKKLTNTFLPQSKLQSRETSHSTQTEKSSILGSNSQVSGTKGMGASSQLKELLPLQGQKERIIINPGALIERS
jgi:hypothetical protein